MRERRWLSIGSRIACLAAAALLGFASHAPALADQGMAERLIPRINSEIQNGVWFETGRLLMTPEVALDTQGLLLIHAVACRHQGSVDAAFVDSCRRGEADDMARTTATVDPKGVDPSSVQLHAGAGNTNEVNFRCKTGLPCITLADGSKQVNHASLICNDPTACNRLVLDFSSFLDFASQSPAEPTPDQAITALVTTINQGIGQGVWIGDTLVQFSAKLIREPGLKLLIQGKVCATSRDNPDPQEVRDCLAGDFLQSSQANMLVTAAGIDAGSIRLAVGDSNKQEGGYAVDFKCREGQNCIIEADSRKPLALGVLICNDKQSCDQLLPEFRQLVDMMKKRAP